MAFTIHFFYRPSRYTHINNANEKELKHQIKHCRGGLHEVTYLEEKDFAIYKVTVPSNNVMALIRDVPQVYHIWDICVSHIQEIFYTSKYHTEARNFFAPSDPDLKRVYWASCKTDLRERKTY